MPNVLPHLLEHLWAAYTQYVTAEHTKLVEAGKPRRGDLEHYLAKAPAQHFYAWAAEYLRTHRVSQSFAVDANLGLMLSNGSRVTVCPHIDVAGTMQDAGAVDITRGQGQPELHGIVQTSPVLEIR